jgi:predicted DNA-binding transcriptional regulator YafY
MLNPYIGRTVNLIYRDRHRNITFRTVRVNRIKGNLVYAYCYLAKAPRMFKADQIIDVELLQHVS